VFNAGRRLKIGASMFGNKAIEVRGPVCLRIPMIESSVDAAPEPTPSPFPTFAVAALNCIAFTAIPIPLPVMRFAIFNRFTVWSRRAFRAERNSNSCAIRFLEWLETTSLKQKTQTYYQTGWRLLSTSPVSKMRLNCITGDDVSALRFPASASNANCALRTLRRMLHKAEEWKLIFRAPKFRLVKEHGRSLPLDSAMEAKLIIAAAECNWRSRSFELFRDVVVLMRETGMRNERELYRVCIENIDWMSKSIFIPDSKTASGRRKVPMSDRAMGILSARCAGRNEGWVFPSKRSRSGHLTTVGKLFREARDKAGLPKELVLYCSRHDYGTRVLRETGNLAAVMKTMGHKDVRTTMRYQHPELDIVRDALNATQTMTIQ
jgi:integrase